LASKAKLLEERENWKRLEEIPFSSENKYMGVYTEEKSTKKKLYFIKGALEVIVEKCTKCYIDKSISDMTQKEIEIIREASNEIAGNNLMTMGIAYGDTMESLVFVGILGIMDPPRKEVKETIKTLKKASIRTIMITGDAKNTAIAIGKELGIINDEYPLSLGPQDLKESDFKEKIKKTSVFYRMAPLHKQLIVQTLQDNKDIVAMTGDGVNDAPALVLSNIGIAMGKSGTDVCKEASQMILVDDNFSTILAAIEEGKGIFNNIKNFIRFQLTTSIAALSIIAISNILGYPLPLNPMQILWINIIMDGPPAQSLGVEPVDPEVMNTPPRDTKKNVIDKRMLISIITGAFVMLIGTMFIFIREKNFDGKVTQRDTTMTFTTFIMFQMFNAFNCRSGSKSVFSMGLFSNKAFVISIALSMIGQLILIYVPFMQFIFETQAISFSDFSLIIMVSSSVLIFEEIFKIFLRRSTNK
jgi:P-type Ca2+ transporter type 2C